jgi:acyl carrier protein
MDATQSLTARVQQIVADALQAPGESVTPDLAFGDLPQWDSLGHMEVMLQLEDQFGVAVDTDTIAQLISIPEICQHLQEHGYV